ncbi:hypothetical protein HDU96_009016 [Phlyctochytrium bullatum]|nr:hypothetical protein HDU96_009016 [Phlyctochytrium bullatum]
MSSIRDLSTEVLLQIVCHLHPNELPALAAVCRSLRYRLSPDSLPVSFAKSHLEEHTRRSVSERYLRGRWCSRWLHRLEETERSVDYDHPLLFNYGIAAVALHGFTFSKTRHLAKLMLGSDWTTKLRDPSDQARRDARVRILAEAFRLGWWDLEKMPNTVERNGNSELEAVDAFTLAALCQSTNVIEALMAKYTAEPFKTERPALKKAFTVAAEYRSMDMVNLILATLNDDTIETISNDFASVLVERCIVLDFHDPIALMDDRHMELNGPFPLTHAVRYNREEMVRLLYSKGWFSPPSAAICMAAKRSITSSDEPNPRASIMRFFLDMGGDPNVQGGHTDECRTPMHEAARTGADDIVQILLEHGAKPDPVDLQGYTPLFHACERNHVEIVEMLLKAGANASYVLPETGENLLHVAGRKAGLVPERRYQPKLVKLVWEANKSLLGQRSKSGQTPLDVARLNDFPNLRELLGLAEGP